MEEICQSWGLGLDDAVMMTRGVKMIAWGVGSSDPHTSVLSLKKLI
jgi:hypothetical protein